MNGVWTVLMGIGVTTIGVILLRTQIGFSEKKKVIDPFRMPGALGVIFMGVALIFIGIGMLLDGR